jgi:hypothetical protein
MVNVNPAGEAGLAGDPWTATKTGASGPVNHLLFLSHCVPAPPDKGEKIRAYHEIQQLASRYRIHLVCFARSQSEVRAGLSVCAVFTRALPRWSLVRAAARLLWAMV